MTKLSAARIRANKKWDEKINRGKHTSVSDLLPKALY